MSFHGTAFKQGRDILAWDPINGWLIRRPWSGTPNEMAALRTNLVLNRIKFEDGPGIEGGYETVWGIFSADPSTQPPDEALSDSWELVGNDLEKDIWGHERISAVFDQLMNEDGTPSEQ